MSVITNKMDISSIVKKRRIDLDITQEQVALLAGCSRFFIIELEAGKKTVRLDKLELVASVLGLTVTLVDRKFYETD